VRAARQSLASAQSAYEQMHQQAQQTANLASNSSDGGLAAAAIVASGVSEGAGVALVTDAENDLREAESELARTPRVISEEVKREARYPVVEIATHATTPVMVRLDGFGTPIIQQTELTADTSTEQVIGSDDIGVSDEDPDTASNAALTPSLEPALSNIAQQVGQQVATLEEDAAWSAFVAMRDRGQIEAAADAGAAYLEISRTPATHQHEIIEYLVEELP
jgi:hypothetical protein